MMNIVIVIINSNSKEHNNSKSIVREIVIVTEQVTENILVPGRRVAARAVRGALLLCRCITNNIYIYEYMI